jgi:hypothetical protein
MARSRDGNLRLGFNLLQHELAIAQALVGLLLAEDIKLAVLHGR